MVGTKKIEYRSIFSLMVIKASFIIKSNIELIVKVYGNTKSLCVFYSFFMLIPIMLPKIVLDNRIT